MTNDIIRLTLKYNYYDMETQEYAVNIYYENELVDYERLTHILDQCRLTSINSNTVRDKYFTITSFKYTPNVNKTLKIRGLLGIRFINDTIVNYKGRNVKLTRSEMMLNKLSYKSLMLPKYIKLYPAYNTLIKISDIDGRNVHIHDFEFTIEACSKGSLVNDIIIPSSILLIGLYILMKILK